MLVDDDAAVNVDVNVDDDGGDNIDDDVDVNADDGGVTEGWWLHPSTV